MFVVLLVRFVFFQAEDGIRDLVRSRGLGDVYKRQNLLNAEQMNVCQDHQSSMEMQIRIQVRVHSPQDSLVRAPVSYTHLTLPTSDLV